MNITPIEIRQKEFERHFRGYDKDEVNAFLHTLSQAWERVLQENREKSARLEQAEKDIEKVREVEGSLFRTLRTAEDTGTEIVGKAQRQADEALRDAEQRKQEILDEAYARAKTIVEDARNEAAAAVHGLHERVDQLKEEAEEAESRRQYALAQLQELADRIHRQVANAQPSSADEAAAESERQLDRLEASVGEAEEPISEPLPPAEDEPEASPSDESPEELAPTEEPYEVEAESPTYEPVWATDEPETEPEPVATRPKRGSFFDDLE